MKKQQISQKVLDELSELPNVSLICKKLNISRQTFYRWKKEDPDFADEIENSLTCGIESISDLAESKLIENIKGGKQRAIEYWLGNNKKAYIKPRVVHIHTNEGNNRLSEQEKDRLLSLLE
jgi:hypothetical protein